MEEKIIRKYSLIGFSDDLGIRNLNGRLGAADGPKVFLEYFHKLNGRFAVKESCEESIFVPMGSNLEQNHSNSIDCVAEVLARHPASPLLVVGGGHDYAYSWLKGISKNLLKNEKVGCINLDAHFDLRPYDPVMTSGSPFRRLLEEKIIEPKNLIQFGIQEHCNSQALYEYAAKLKIKTVPFSSVRNGKAVAQFKRSLLTLKKTCTQIVISLDLDALSYAYAPGVSAPQAEGFTASEILEMLEIAGAEKKVNSLGIFEFSPPLDIQNLTARLAAQSAWHFLAKKIHKK